ncbi:MULTISPECIES: P2 [Alcaligenes]|uniref:P2 n=1 Tax=Alcaligenes TaxID=507 RepID=UPI0002AA8D3C|nr:MULTISPECIES: P2 [Alcaligenes]EKU31669.1 P2 [Alcaligenes sp. HPC1271]ERI34690.1 hypothetical protein N879_03895 [Alcaligenes sp. EGD-AK7]HRO22386.1 transcriptional regulator [Alcaligenes phenolicus]HRP13343.1 transcriptional regulator [Alcaligenes phenolicus]
MNKKKANTSTQKTPVPAKPSHTLAALLADVEASGAYPLPPEEREWVDAPAVGRELLVEDLQSAEAIHAYLAHAEATGDVAYIEHAREIAGQAKIRYRIK